MTHSDPLTIWAVSDGRAGMENQALGLAEAIARQHPAEIVLKRIAIAAPFDKLPGRLWGDPLKRLAAISDTLTPPWPDLWIGCGRLTVPLGKAVQDLGPITVQCQDPGIGTEQFDFVVPPAHDILRGHNVLPILGAPNRLSEQRLRDDAERLAGALPPLPRPLAAVLIGGSSKDYRLTETGLADLLATLRQVMAAGIGLMITPSRRTGEDVTRKLKAGLAGPTAWVWDGAPIGGLTNPYFGMLGLADRVFVTEESTNMITDAAFTGRPVHLLRLEGGAPKWERFQADLINRGVIRPGATVDQTWSYPPVRETERVAVEILQRLAL